MDKYSLWDYIFYTCSDFGATVWELWEVTERFILKVLNELWYQFTDWL